MSRSKKQSPTRKAHSKTTQAAKPGISRHAHLLILGVALLFASYCRIRLLDVPLERDEGEYAYVGQQLLEGIPPFVSIYHVKLPGIYGAYAALESVFGQTHNAIHLGLLFINVLTAVVIYLLGRRIFDPLSGALAATVFCVLSLSQKLQGFSANAEHFVVFPALLGILFLLRAFDPSASPAARKRRILDAPGLNLFLSGLMLGISYTMKQHGIFFIGFAGAFFLYKWLMQRPLNGRFLVTNGLTWVLAVVLPLGFICIYFLSLGLFNKFWWWTWYYPREYASLISWEDGKQYLKFTFNPDGEGKGIWDVFWLLILLAGAGLIGLLKERNWSRAFFGVGLFLSSAIAVSVGFSFYPHYFLLIAPATGFLCASGAAFISSLFKRSNLGFLKYYMGAAVLLTCVLSGISNERDYLFKMDGVTVCRSTYGGNPFPESIELGKYLKQNTAPMDRIAVFGSEPQIPFYAKRRSATGYVYTYEMMADHPYDHQFQLEMAKEVEAARPKFVVMVNIAASWFARRVKKVDSFLFEWSQQFISAHYTQVGIVDSGVFCWDAPGQQPCRPKTSDWMGIYRRRE